ncbi:hypothetical protein HOY80DRAFT_886009, partial [Tuber brumale]
LPWKVRWQDLKDLVRKHTANIERAEIYLTPDGRSRGFGYARVRGREEAMKVVANLDGYEWEARALMVKLGNEHDMCPTAEAINPYYSTIEPAPIFVTPDRGLPVNLTNGALITESRGVFVGNLAYDTQWQELKGFLEPAGHLERCDVPQTDGRGRGYGTALFSSAEGAQRACYMFDQQFFKGRQIKVRLDKYTMRKQNNPAFIPPVSQAASGPLVANLAPAPH